MKWGEMADIEFNPDGTINVPTGYLSTKQVASLTLEATILSLYELRKVNENMATLRERLTELTTAVQGVAERVGASDIPSLSAALAAARAQVDELTATVTGERAADLAEDAAYEARVNELTSNLSASVSEAEAAAESIGQNVETLNSIAPATPGPVEPTPDPVTPTDPTTPVDPAPVDPGTPSEPVTPAPEGPVTPDAPEAPVVPDVGTDRP